MSDLKEFFLSVFLRDLSLHSLLQEGTIPFKDRWGFFLVCFLRHEIGGFDSDITVWAF